MPATSQGKEPSTEIGQRQKKVGVVTSDRMNKTVVVAVERLVTHARYGKRQRRTTAFMAHDEKNQCRIGDQVAIEETRPLSKKKRWRVIEVMRQGPGVAPSPAELEAAEIA